MMASLAGLHDLESVKIAPPNTWVLDTIALSENPVPHTYPLTLNVIVRVNWGYGSTGTLPVPDQYPAFALRLANYVKASHGCSRWVIGNEPNLPREWPAQWAPQPIYPAQYAACYRLCRNAIHALPGHERDEVLIAASGPWNTEFKYQGNPKGDWIQYFTDAISALRNKDGSYEIDGFSIHSYTHGYSVALVSSSARMTADGYQSRRSEFRTYLDYLEAIPAELNSLGVYMTEANGNGPWQAVGLMPAMLADIDAYNQRGNIKIRCVIFFRFPNFGDGYNIEGKDEVIKEYLAAAGRGYSSPTALIELGAKPVTETTYVPLVSNGVPAPALSPRIWDEQLTKRGVTIQTPNVAAGQQFWRVRAGHWLNPTDSQGRHHILGNVFADNAKQAGVPLRVVWPTGIDTVKTEDKSKDYPPFNFWYNFAMSKSLNDYSILVADGKPTEVVKGIGMGMDGNSGEHTCTVIEWELVTMPASTEKPQVPTTTTPATIQYVAVRDGANLRDTPGVGTVLLSIPYGESVAVDGVQLYEGSSWARATYQKKTGWILSILLDRVKPAPLPPTTPTSPPQGPTTPTRPAVGSLDPLLLEAIVLTESGGSGFQDGRLKIRLEAHLLLGATWGNPSLLAPYFRYDAKNILNADFRTDPNGPWHPLHASQNSEWEAFAFASRIDAQATLRCMSMGAGQIMGFNAKRCGYGSPLEMFNAFKRSEIAQTVAIVTYCMADPALMQAIATRDFAGITRGYNGVGLEAVYTPILKSNYQKVGGSL
jgi:hypothetical protein